MTAVDLIAATTISRVFVGLGGDEPKSGRARAFYRDGDNRHAVSLNDARGCWYDHRDGVGGGMLDLIQHVLGCERVEALQWLSRFTGLTLDDQRATRAERRAIAERRESELGEMRSAEFFRIAAACMAEEILDELPEAVPERYAPTQLLLLLRPARGKALLAIYRDFRARYPKLTAALVFAGERAWLRMSTRLARFVAAGMEVPDVT